MRYETPVAPFPSYVFDTEYTPVEMQIAGFMPNIDLMARYKAYLKECNAF